MENSTVYPLNFYKNSLQNQVVIIVFVNELNKRDVFTLCYKKRFGFLAPFQTIPTIYYYQIRRDHYYCDSNLLHTYYLTSICIFESGGRVFSNAD